MVREPVILLDTHVWIWWLSDPERLSTRATQAISEAKARGNILVSSISAWELATLSKKWLQLSIEAADWIARSEALPFLQFIPVDNQIAVKATLPGEPRHEDPVDRIIIATALVLGATLITMDEKIRKDPRVRTLW